MLDLIKEKNKCSLWRFMIDKKYQGRGYGKIALTQVINYVISLKVFRKIKTSFVPGGKFAEEFYRNFGFVDAEEVIKKFRLENSDQI